LNSQQAEALVDVLGDATSEEFKHPKAIAARVIGVRFQLTDSIHLCQPEDIKPASQTAGFFAACFSMSECSKRINPSLASKAALTSLLSL